MPARLLQFGDFRFDGVYRLTSQSGMGAEGGLAYRPATDTWFTIGNLSAQQPLLEIRLPTAAPGLDATTAPQATLVRDWGTGLWTGFIDVTAGNASDEIRGLFWDNVTQRLFVLFCDSYAVAANTFNVVSIEFTASGPQLRGPWRNDGHPRHAYAQYQDTPPALRALVGGKRLLACGRRDSTGQYDPWGPNLMAMDAPSDALPPQSVLPQQSLMFWPMVTTKYTCQHGVATVTHGNYPRADGWSWIENYGTSATSYQQQPYYEFDIPPKWHRSDNGGQFVYIDHTDVRGLLVFGQYVDGAGWYGAPDEVGNPSKSSQLIASKAFPPGYVTDHAGGARGTHYEEATHCAWLIDPAEIEASARGDRDTRISHYAWTKLRDAWPGLAQTLSHPTKPEIQGVYYEAVPRRLYVLLGPSPPSKFNTVHVWTLVGGGTPQPPQVPQPPYNATVVMSGTYGTPPPCDDEPAPGEYGAQGHLHREETR